MGYENYITELLEPLGVYNFENGPQTAEIYALGSMLDEVFNITSELEREMTIPTASGYGLEKYEELLPQKPAYSGLEARREAIMALLQIDGICFTPELICETLAGCGIAAVAEETDDKYIVKITFPGVYGIPENIELLKERIEAIIPCHLECLYAYAYATWYEVEEAFPKLSDIESAGITWKELEEHCF